MAELKSRLSEHLRAVRRGETIAIMHRDTPIARLVPAGERPALRLRKPARGASPLRSVPLPPPLGLDLDIVELLLEERQGSR